MRGVRRKTAQHLWEAWTTIPHVTQQDKADITELEQLRARFAPKAEEAGGKMTVTAIALESLRLGAESLSAVQCQHRHGEGRDRLQAVHQYRRCRGYRPRPAGPGDSRCGQEEHRRTGGRTDPAFEESARQEAHARRNGRRDLHDHESRRHWRHRIFADRELSGSRDSRACRAPAWSRSG